jgi:hypothetical protein
MGREIKIKFRFANKGTSEITKLPFIRLVYISIAINLIGMLSVLFLKKSIPPEVPLFYGLAEGESQLARREMLMIPSMVSLLIILINVSFALLVQNEFLKRTLIISSLVITLLSVITLVEIILLVGKIP